MVKIDSCIIFSEKMFFPEVSLLGFCKENRVSETYNGSYCLQFVGLPVGLPVCLPE